MLTIKPTLVNNICALLSTLLFTSCNQYTNQIKPIETKVIQVWAHAGQEDERKILQSQVKRFNQRNTSTDIKSHLYPGTSI